MRLTVLGANGSYPAPGGACSGYLVRHDGYTVWMDAGNGTLGRLQLHEPILDVDAVILSHVHLDHCADFFPFFYALLFEAKRRVPVLCPPGSREKLEPLIGADTRAKFGELFDWRVLHPGDETELGPLGVRIFDAAHSAPNLTVRLEAAGKSLCYSGDTGPNPDLVRAAEGADVFLCEAAWLEEHEGLMAPVHMRASQVGEAARDAAVRRLVLTHIWPGNDLTTVRTQTAESYDGPITFAVETEHVDV